MDVARLKKLEKKEDLEHYINSIEKRLKEEENYVSDYLEYIFTIKYEFNSRYFSF